MTFFVVQLNIDHLHYDECIFRCRGWGLVYHQKQVISLTEGHPCYYILLCWGFSPDDAEADSIDFKLAPSKRLSHLQNDDRVLLMIFQMMKYFKTTLNHILLLIIVF